MSDSENGGVEPLELPSGIVKIKKESPEDEVKIKALREPIIAKAIREGNIMVRELEGFDTVVVYAFGSLKLYQALRKKLGQPVTENREASGYCCFWQSQIGRNGFIAIVWVNDTYLKNRLDGLPSFVHEISHLADYVFNQTGIDNPSGEAKAYFMENEFAKVANKFFGMDLEPAITENQVMEALNDKPDKSDKSDK